jgi:hypothetical protein
MVPLPSDYKALFPKKSLFIKYPESTEKEIKSQNASKDIPIAWKALSWDAGS